MDGSSLAPSRFLAHMAATCPPNSLSWLPDQGIGYYPIGPATQYGDEYWHRYRGYDATPMGRALTSARLDLCLQFVPPRDLPLMVDVGIGGGAFVEAAGCYGWDVNPLAEAWLRARGSWREPEPGDTVTAWDVIEHMPHEQLSNLLTGAKRLFVATPIYETYAGILQSRHFRPGEHCWYFTASGLERLLLRFGLVRKKITLVETELGRDAIWSFVFERAEA